MAKADPLPYIVVFAILFYISLGLLTWVLYEFNKAWQCPLNPNIWCADDFTCTNSCSEGNSNGQPVNSCFISVRDSGLASCLFGPMTSGATACFAYESTASSCICSNIMTSPTTNSCFNSCPLHLADVPDSISCCCLPGKGGCDPNRTVCPNISNN